MSSLLSDGLPQCRFFSTPSGCRNGNDCPFLHDSLKIPICKFYQTVGGCKWGSQCKFSHSKSSAMNVQHNGEKLQPPVSTHHISSPIVSIDVECVATGFSHTDRAVARIAVVGENEETLFDKYVKPSQPVVSCLSPLTGIHPSHLANAESLETVVSKLKKIIGNNSCIVGQSITKDIEWIGLEKGIDFKDFFDISHLFRIQHGKRHQVFSLRHVTKYLMDENIQEEDHDPVVDAVYAMKIFKKFRNLHENPNYLRAVQSTLSKTPQTPSFAQKQPFIDGVALSASSKKA